ncbi:MAG: transposase [Chloroflexi bacterium]|nr:MAG: transposase [Chloroflexota bacterium]
MPYDPQKHHRRSIRIQGIDYSEPGAYYITIVTDNRAGILSTIRDGAIVLSLAGKAFFQIWQNLPRHYHHLALGDIVIMPNHIHAVLYLNPGNIQPEAAISEIIRALKSYSARRINSLRHTPGKSVWQRDYFERIIRDQEELDRIREYILTNPLQWELDQENPENL